MSGTCTSCGARRAPYGSAAYGYARYACHGWCARCYARWLSNGKPVTGPPAPRKPGGSGQREEYWFLRSQGYSRQDAGMRLGVTRRTILRYEAAARQEANAA